MLEAKTKDQGHKCKCFLKKKDLKKFFSVNLQKKKNGLEKHFSADLQNFNHSKNSAVFEPRTGQFSRTWGFEAEAKAKDLKMCPRGLHLYTKYALSSQILNLTIVTTDSKINQISRNKNMELHPYRY